MAHIRMCGIFRPSLGERAHGGSKQRRGVLVDGVRSVLKTSPVLWRYLRKFARSSREVRHFVEGYRFLRAHDLLIVSGGGQLSEEYEGAWRHPWGLFKWALLARIARVPFVTVSVGASKVDSRTTRMFVSAALRMARYRSYRDENSRRIVVSHLLQRAATDPIVPDLAFSLPSSELPPPAGIRAMAQSRTVIAISLIAIGKPGEWPTKDVPLYHRYLQEMAQVVSQLLRRGYFLVFVKSSLDEDEVVLSEVLERLENELTERLAEQAYTPTIETWQEYVAALKDVDLLIASRLHSTILAFMAGTPTIAISPSAKVDSVMEDLGQTDYLLQIRNFMSADVIEALDRLELRKDGVLQQIASYRYRVLPIAALQYDTLAELAVASCRKR
jgi:polysaccharide pyruvyl transferase WcaK-like protein